METIQTPQPIDYHSNVDTSRPFSSVKEAVAVFGERFLTPEVYSPKPFSFPKQEPSWKSFSPSPAYSQVSKQSLNNNTLVDTLRKLENKLEETKEELKLLKERESENEVALASLNAELHKNMSKIAAAEAAAAAGKAAAATRDGEDRRRDLMAKMENSPTLAQILSFSQEIEGGFGGGKKERNMRKKKPIIPLVGDFLWRKKGSSTTLHNPLYSSPGVHWN